MSNLEKVCPLAWIEYSVTPYSASPCCWSGLKSFDFYKGPWEGDKLWNEKEFIDFRRKMLQYGKETVCRGCYCPIKFTDSTNIKRFFYGNPKGVDEYISLAMKRIENGECFLDYDPAIFHFCFGFKCNSRCVMCYYSLSEKHRCCKTQTEKFYSFRHYINNSFRLNLTGGELFSLSDNEIELLLGQIDQTRTSVELATNASLMTLERYEKFIENGRISHLHVSLDSLSPGKYKILRGIDLSMMMNNLKDISSKYPKHKIESFTMVVSKLNYDEMFSIAKFASEFGVKYISFQPIWGGALHLNGCEFLDIFNLAYTEKIHEEIKEQISMCMSLESRSGFRVFGTETTLRTLEDRKQAIKAKTNMVGAAGIEPAISAV